MGRGWRWGVLMCNWGLWKASAPIALLHLLCWSLQMPHETAVEQERAGLVPAFSLFSCSQRLSYWKVKAASGLARELRDLGTPLGLKQGSHWSSINPRGYLGGLRELFCLPVQSFLNIHVGIHILLLYVAFHFSFVIVKV